MVENRAKTRAGFSKFPEIGAGEGWAIKLVIEFEEGGDTQVGVPRVILSMHSRLHISETQYIDICIKCI